MTYIGAFALAILFLAAILRMDGFTAGFWLLLALFGIGIVMTIRAIEERRSEQ